MSNPVGLYRPSNPTQNPVFSNNERLVTVVQQTWQQSRAADKRALVKEFPYLAQSASYQITVLRNERPQVKNLWQPHNSQFQYKN